MLKAVDACWQQQAERAGVSIGDVRYELEVRDFRVRGLMGAYVHSSGTIYIDTDEIRAQSRGIPANNYDLLVEMIMHERLHAEHGHHESTNNNERTTWGDTVDRYKAIFDKDPPLIYGEGTQGGANPKYRKHDDGIPTCE